MHIFQYMLDHNESQKKLQTYWSRTSVSFRTSRPFWMILTCINIHQIIRRIKTKINTTQNSNKNVTMYEYMRFTWRCPNPCLKISKSKLRSTHRNSSERKLGLWGVLTGWDGGGASRKRGKAKRSERWVTLWRF